MPVIRIKWKCSISSQGFLRAGLFREGRDLPLPIYQRLRLSACCEVLCPSPVTATQFFLASQGLRRILRLLNNHTRSLPSRRNFWKIVLHIQGGGWGMEPCDNLMKVLDPLHKRSGPDQVSHTTSGIPVPSPFQGTEACSRAGAKIMLSIQHDICGATTWYIPAPWWGSNVPSSMGPFPV